jgi:hypothetical protein
VSGLQSETDASERSSPLQAIEVELRLLDVSGIDPNGGLIVVPALCTSEMSLPGTTVRINCNIESLDRKRLEAHIKRLEDEQKQRLVFKFNQVSGQIEMFGLGGHRHN